jgi:AraC-like DNA-binding protein
MSDFTFIRGYFNHKNPPEDVQGYFRKFISTNVIVNTISNHIFFTKKKSGLSIKCAFNGSEIYETDSGRFRIDDNCYLVLNREQQYSGYIESQADVESFSIFFEKCMVDDVLGALLSENYEEIIEYFENRKDIQPVLFIEKTYPHNKQISPALFNLREYIKNDFTDNFYIEEQFHIILSLLFDVHKNIIDTIREFPSIKPGTKIEIYKRLNLAKDYIDSSFDTDISLKFISVIACISPHHFLRLFKKLFSMTPHQYLTAKRLETAKKLLISTDYHITEISKKTGFENLSTFSRLFKQHNSVSPELYRTFNRTKKSILVK